MNKSNKANSIFIHKTIKAIADSVVKVFIPLLILKASESMPFVMVYICSYYFFCASINIILKRFLQKYGVIAIILHFIPLIIMQFLLVLKISWGLCILLSFLASLSQVLYSVPINILFCFTDKRINVAKFDISTNIGKIIFILISGYVLGSDFSNSIIIMTSVSTVLYFSSSIPLLYGYKILKEKYNCFDGHCDCDKRTYNLFNLYHILFGIFQSVIDVVLPLFLYINNLSFQSVAIVLVLIEICKIISNLLAKYLSSKKLPFVSVLISVIAMSTSCIAIIFAKTPVILYICSCCLGISFPLLFVPLFEVFVKKIIRDNNQFDGLTYRDVYIFSLRPILYIPYFIFPSLIVQLVMGIACSASIGVVSYSILKQKNSSLQ